MFGQRLPVNIKPLGDVFLAVARLGIGLDLAPLDVGGLPRGAAFGLRRCRRLLLLRHNGPVCPANF
jgi:hypothetical protein